MRYYLDTEFDGFGGQLLRLAIVAEDDRSLYLINRDGSPESEWVLENVWSPDVLFKVPTRYTYTNLERFPFYIAEFLDGDPDPIIVTDWPDDISYFCRSVITGPGQMAQIPSLKFEMHRVDAYPTTLEGAVQHNAWWDAMALQLKLANPKEM